MTDAECGNAMKTYFFRYKIEPQGPFGLPEGQDHIVVPSVDEEGNNVKIVANPIDTISLKQSGYGTLSRYRTDEKKIKINYVVPNGKITIRDNFMDIALLQSSIEEARKYAYAYSERLMESLSIKKLMPFKAIPISVFDDNNKIYDNNPRFVIGMTFTTYNLSELTDQLSTSLDEIEHFDDTLDKACFYFRHALILDQSRAKNMEHWVGHSLYMSTSVILNFWKATTSIMGDPVNKKDGYQKKFRIYGLPDDFKSRMDRVKKFRDDNDVAHYTTSHNSLEEAAKHISESRDLARIAIDAYVKYIRKLS